MLWHMLDPRRHTEAKVLDGVEAVEATMDVPHAKPTGSLMCLFAPVSNGHACLRLGLEIAHSTLISQVCSSHGAMLVGTPCAISGLTTPNNGALDSACVAASLAHGASCTVTCNVGYVLSGTQPSCYAGNFDAGDAICTGLPSLSHTLPLMPHC